MNSDTTSRYDREAKQTRTLRCLGRRKEHTFPEGLKNPSELPGDCDHLNAWSLWHGDLDADLLLMAQDFSDADYFKQHGGKDKDHLATNDDLIRLFKNAGMQIAERGLPATNHRLYFTNAVLGLKTDGGMGGKINVAWLRDEGTLQMHRELIDIVQPKIVVAMGQAAYTTLCTIYTLRQMKFRDAVNEAEHALPDGKAMFVVYHTSRRVLRYRNSRPQQLDWQRIAEYRATLYQSSSRKHQLT